MSKCEQCQRGPIGIEGHLSLFAHRLGSKSVEFTCRACEAHWARTSGQSGTFTWMLSTHTAGPVLPRG